jgi:fibro-slime domain-containing protein
MQGSSRARWPTPRLLALIIVAAGCAGPSEARTFGELAPDDASPALSPSTSVHDASTVPLPPELVSEASVKADAQAADGRCGAMRARVRDFKREHPDFEHIVNGRVVTGIVSPLLGSEHKPSVNASTALSNGVMRFEDWYADRDGVNLPFEVDIQLRGAGDGRFVFDSSAFFPLDDKGFGKEYLDHNFHFTTEIHTRFTYRAGDQFTFVGDDDLWLFINGRLAIDLGGVHGREEKSVSLDQRAGELGISPGTSYPMDIFHAERHTGSSNFRIETTIACIEPVELL